MNPEDIAIFTGTANFSLAAAVARILGVQLGNVRVARFEDGKVDVQILQDVRGLDVYIVQPDGPSAEWMTEIHYLIIAAKRSAMRVTIILPYFSSGRGDRRDEPGKLIPAELDARLYVATGVDRIVLFDLHADQVVGMFEAAGAEHVDALYFRPVILDRLSREDLSHAIVTSPDFGRLKVVRSFWKRLHLMGHPVEIGAIEKNGTSSTGIDNFTVFGDFKDRHAHVFDDILGTGTTIIGASQAALNAGAIDVSVWISHAVLPSTTTMDKRLRACEKLVASPIKRFFFSDSMPLGKEEFEIFGDRLEIVTISQLLALVIKRLHDPRSGHRLSSAFELNGYRDAVAKLTAV